MNIYIHVNGMCVRVCKDAYKRLCVSVRIHTYIHRHTHSCMHTSIDNHLICSFVCVFVCVCVCARARARFSFYVCVFVLAYYLDTRTHVSTPFTVILVLSLINLSSRYSSYYKECMRRRYSHAATHLP